MRRYIVPQIEAVCQSVTDSLWWRIKQPEFAFTLYYYDRAGNRVAVVPPDGVEMLSDDSTAMVPGARTSGNVLRPTHRKVVLWRYTASNQVWMRHHPDRGTDLTWYDPVDRPIATQDARQRAENKVSFIKYDSLSRPIEGGVASLYSNFTNFAYENNVPINTSIVWDRFVQVYDTAATGSPISSGHFRGRVTTHKVWQKWTGSEEPDYIVYYDYDLMGRVKREIHEIPMLKRFKHDKFEMIYLYDAISGKVREMVYNKGKKDEFRHRFAYDAMGNLKYVWTSKDGKKWTLESALKYYPDGKLMRREIRPKDLMLQGLDYAYTLDGWLKAINSEILSNDPSQDGILGTYQYFARDVFSLLLRYYPNDYKPIKLTATPLEASITSGNQHLYKPYYTGWISSWSLHLDTLHTAYSLRYDRLGRLTKATTLTGFNGTEWSASLIKNYSTKYSYDLVGNILNLTRYDGSGRLLDSLVYEYYNPLKNNRLRRLKDYVNTPIPIDLETQPANNYSYDPVGNMIEDRSRNLKVSYTYSNKPRRVNLGGQTIRMLYNPSGYRFFKGKGANKGQIFVYNSQGQLMAKYAINGRKLKLDFVPIYEGMRRLGILELSGVLWIDCPPPRLCFEEDSLGFVQLLIPSSGGSGGGVLKAEKKYELTDHLGNVRVVISDQRVPVSTDGSTVAYYKPLVHEISDYYPYGWQKVLGKYQFGANAGSLFEDWDSTRGTYYTLYRLLDARVARWYQVDRQWQLFVSDYIPFANNPLLYSDIKGDIIDVSELDSEQRKRFEQVVSELRKSSLFNKVYNEVHNSPEYFKIYAPSVTPSNLYELHVLGGYFKQAERVTFWGFTIYEPGEEENPHKIVLNKYRRGFTHSVIFEEIFHAGQYLFEQRTGQKQSALSKEVEVRVAKAFVAYQIQRGKANIRGFRIESYVYEFMNRKEVQAYFNALITGGAVSKDLEANFRKAVKDLARDVYNTYSKIHGWNPGQSLESYTGATPYFDELVKNNAKQ